jgi:predicted Zn-ribbon and HTH transcriptional regulator
MEIQLSKAYCNRCGYEWVPRKPKIHVCPHCHSFTWYQEEGVKSSKYHDWKKGVKKHDK